MPIPRASAGLLILLALAAPLALTACGGDTPPPRYAPLSYGYLRPLRLNVGTVDVVNAWAPPPDSDEVSDLSPANPADVLSQMARDRLVPAGAAGRAVFTVQQASITDTDGLLHGLFRVRVDIFTSDGQRAAFADAAVARTGTAPDRDDNEAMRAALYGFTRQMMSDMNVELEYQLRRSIGDWLKTGAALAPPPIPVQQQPLAAPDATPGYRLVPSPPPSSP